MLSLIYTAFLLSWTEGRIFGPVFQPNAGLYGAIGLQPNLGFGNNRGSGFQPHTFAVSPTIWCVYSDSSVVVL